MRQCQRLTIWSGCPTHAKTKTGRWDPRLTSFVRGPVLSNSVCTGIQVLPKCYRDPPYPNFLRGSTDAGQKSGILQLPNGDPQMTFDRGWAVASLLLHCCGGAVCWRPAISLPVQSVVVGEVGRCVGVRWRADSCVGVLRTGSVAAGVRVYSSVSHL